jgi:UDP-N-acetylglucosamine 2-epimerase (non-hydrolysing)
VIETAVVVIGTRPEAIKLGPVVHALRLAGVQVMVVSTGQQQQQLAQALGAMDLRPDVNLSIPPGHPTSTFVGVATTAIAEVLRRLRPQAVIVQGDTSSALAGALAGFYEAIRVAHVEAGLRTQDLDSPFPEEAHRQIIARLAHWNFAPTWRAAQHLERERVAGEVFVTGNTGIDALQWKARQLGLERSTELEARPLVLVTMHRRESIGDQLADVCKAVRELAEHREIRVLWPVHLNPKVRGRSCSRS